MFPDPCIGHPAVPLAIAFSHKLFSGSIKLVSRQPAKRLNTD